MDSISKTVTSNLGTQPSRPSVHPQPGTDTASSDTVTWTFQYDARGMQGTISDLRLKGSFNPETGAPDPQWNGGKAVPMRDDGQGGDRRAQDGVYTLQLPIKNFPGQTFQWGVVGSGPKGPDQWLVLQDDPLQFTVGSQEPVSTYAPVSNHLYGVQRQGDDVRFQTWSPALGTGPTAGYKLHVDLYNDKGELDRTIPMEKDPKTGDWSVKLEGGWKALEGRSYEYAARNEAGEILKTPTGEEVRYADPQSRYLMGQQRGLERIFVDPVLAFETGWYDDSSKGGPNYADNPQFGRFVVDNHGDARNVQLVLMDGEGRQLNRQELLERLGEPTFAPYEQASDKDKHDVNVLRQWTMANSPKLDSYLWTHSVNEDGSIEMKKVETNRTGSGWTVAVNNFPNLVGLKYEFRVFNQDGSLVGDKDSDGKLSDAERVKTPFNDPYDNTISARPSSARRSLIRESQFVPKHADKPRIEDDFRKKVIFELHLGSFLGPKDNGLPPTAEDLVNNMDYLAEMGITDVYMMPTSEFGGKRDWGYTTDHFFAGADAYGFEMPRAQAVAEGLLGKDQATDQESVWIGGTDAIKWLNDKLHERGFSTMGDVVYNHTSGKPDGDNPLYKIDGEANSFFKWGDKHAITPWGAKPDFSKQGVKDFFTNHAVEMATLDGSGMGFDHLRFDFTQVLHNEGDHHQRQEGMETLRQINRTLQTLRPGIVTVAEDFSRNPWVAEDLDRGGEFNGMHMGAGGFRGVWNDSLREAIYKGAGGQVNMDHMMDALLSHHGVTGWDRAVTYSHSHDEVGNSGKYVVRAAAGSKEDIFGHQARAVARSGAALTLTSPGMPMMWQGEEFLSNNDFKHGLTSTWGYNTDWLNFKITPDRLDRFKDLAARPDAKQAAQRELKAEELPFFEKYLAMDESARKEADIHSARAGHFRSYKDLIALRRSSSAFDSDAPVGRVYTHNDDKVIAYSRGSGDEQYIVVTNLHGQDHNGYNVGLPDGYWKEVLNTNAREYGGSGSGNGGATLAGGSGMTLPAGSTIVFKKVG